MWTFSRCPSASSGMRRVGYINAVFREGTELEVHLGLISMEMGLKALRLDGSP